MSSVTTTAPPSASGEAPDDTRVAHRQLWGWWILVAFVALCVGGILKMLLTNDNLQWDVVGDYFFDG